MQHKPTIRQTRNAPNAGLQLDKCVDIQASRVECDAHNLVLAQMWALAVLRQHRVRLRRGEPVNFFLEVELFFLEA
ncbi:hypothetical protein SAMN05444287_2897 [Octadecabacter temperatus]|uniref:Uncharacterized protein n=1 Tax=Octadecabacter temperatus TaxID=1458307 RepID=A0A0K0Y917_9RHOB|nr:hypothetical protein OSB_29360 [Octadecabacter temperatus]SIO42482.1 hypothetical protein SAMN05444287_2897 [Octadecabacter temperatus]